MRHNFPGTDDHTNYHNSLLTRRNTISQEVDQCKVNKPAIEKLMSDWVIQYTRHDDALRAKQA